MHRRFFRWEPAPVGPLLSRRPRPVRSDQSGAARAWRALLGRADGRLGLQPRRVALGRARSGARSVRRPVRCLRGSGRLGRASRTPSSGPSCPSIPSWSRSSPAGTPRWATSKISRENASISAGPVRARRRPGRRSRRRSAGPRPTWRSPPSSTRILRAPRCAPNDVDASVQLVGHPSDRLADELRQCDLALVSVAWPRDCRIRGRPTVLPAWGDPGGDLRRQCGHADLRRQRHAGRLGGSAGRGRVCGRQVDHRRGRPVAEAAIRALAQLEPREMVRAGLTAPLHPGAERAYRELGLIK